MDHIELFKTDKGYISPYKIRWILHEPKKECFEICMKSIGCNGFNEEINRSDTWSVCKTVTVESYSKLLNTIIKKDEK